MMEFFKKAFTGADNATWDLGRILWAKISVVYCALTSYHAIKNGVLNPQDWAIGASAILAGGGGALGLKAKTEPPHVIPSEKSDQ
jgi:hypothetical protein